jgi:hypothetical protein
MVKSFIKSVSLKAEFMQNCPRWSIKPKTAPMISPERIKPAVTLAVAASIASPSFEYFQNNPICTVSLFRQREPATRMLRKTTELS